MSWGFVGDWLFVVGALLAAALLVYGAWLCISAPDSDPRDAAAQAEAPEQAQVEVGSSACDPAHSSGSTRRPCGNRHNRSVPSPLFLEKTLMNATPTFAKSRPSRTVAAAVLATVIALGILSGVATLFQSRGKPMERLAAAERACLHHAFQSEREACIKEWIAKSQATKSVAHR